MMVGKQAEIVWMLVHFLFKKKNMLSLSNSTFLGTSLSIAQLFKTFSLLSMLCFTTAQMLAWYTV